MLRALAALLFVVAVAFATYCVIHSRAVIRPAASTAPGASSEWVWPVPLSIPPQSWAVFHGGGTPDRTPGTPADDRFRLAGTFVLFGESPDGGAPRKAILDDLRRKSQHLVGEGDSLDGYEVLRVHEDRVVMKAGGKEFELWLSFAGGGKEAAPGVTATGGGETPETLQDETRFGGRVGFNRWVMKRDELMRYYQDLLDDPERLASLFVSLKPDYREEQIAGYFLDPEGEEEFFGAVGLRKGDVIRKVNSMNMTSQKRAEHMIGEFVKNRANAFVLDIEREGKPEKMIYLLR
jgi:type II secretion system protein C